MGRSKKKGKIIIQQIIANKNSRHEKIVFAFSNQENKRDNIGQEDLIKKLKKTLTKTNLKNK